MKRTYYGHSALPALGISPDDITVDAVLLTHGHSDSFGGAPAIAKKNSCPIFAAD